MIRIDDGKPRDPAFDALPYYRKGFMASSAGWSYLDRIGRRLAPGKGAVGEASVNNNETGESIVVRAPTKERAIELLRVVLDGLPDKGE